MCIYIYTHLKKTVRYLNTKNFRLFIAINYLFSDKNKYFF